MQTPVTSAEVAPPASQLVSLLLTLFSSGGDMKRELSGWSEFAALRASLPADAVPPAEMADRIVALLGEHGLIGGGLFAQLAAARPHQQVRIDAVAAAYAATTLAASRAPDLAGRHPWSRARLGALLLLLASLAGGTVWKIRSTLGSVDHRAKEGPGDRATSVASTQAPANGDKVSRPARLELMLRGVRLDGGATPGLLSKDTLRSGDLFAFFVTANEPVYLHVIQYFADGGRRVLVPEEGEIRLDPGVETRVPANDAWFRLDDAVGIENLYFVTSPRPLADADPELASLVREIRISPGSGADAPSSADAPPGADAALSPPGARMFLQLRAKGVYTMHVRNGIPVQQASFEPQGTGVVHFQIDHR